MAAQETIQISRPAPYLEAAGQTFLDLLTAKTGQAPTAAQMTAMSPQLLDKMYYHNKLNNKQQHKLDLVH
jgi:hypothetical protein